MMLIDNCYLIMPEDGEEVNMVNEVLLAHREKKQKEEAIQKAKMAISFEISNAIDRIGLAEVKRIIRELNRNLRNIPSEEED